MAEVSMTKTEFKSEVRKILAKAFPGSHIVVETAYGDAFSVKIVSSKFNKMGEHKKQSVVWDAIRGRLKEEAQRIRWIVVYGDDEL